MVKHCAHGLCRSDSRYYHLPHMQGIKFYKLPDKQVQPKKCMRWIKACNREGFTFASVKTTRDTHICSRHFYDGKGPTPDHPDPISATASENRVKRFTQPRRKFSRKIINTTRPANLCDKLVDTTAICLTTPKCVKTYSRLQTSGSAGSVSHVQEPPLLDNVSSASPTTIRILPPDSPSATCVKTPLFEESCAGVSSLFVTPRKQPEVSQTTPSRRNLFHSKTYDNSTVLSINPFHYETVMSCGWHVGSDAKTGCVTYCVITDRVVIKCVTVDTQTGRYTVNIHGKFLDLDDYSSLPVYVSSAKDIECTLAKVNSVRICAGVESGGTTNETTHSSTKLPENCDVVIQTNALRCEECKKKRRNIKRRQLTNAEPTNKYVRLQELNSEELIVLAQEQKKLLMLTNRRNKRLADRFKTLLKSAHKLTSEDGSFFSEIVQQKLNTIDNKSELAIMLTEQIKAATCKGDGKGMRWSPEVIKWAAYIRHKSSAAYDAMNSSGFIKLPSARTISRQFIDFAHDSGFHDHILEDMRKHANIDSSPEDKKYFALVLDEMSIRSNIVYNKNSGELVGFRKLTETSDTMSELLQELEGNAVYVPPVASHMLSLLVRGVTSSFKYAFAHFPTNNLVANELFEIMWQAIEKLEGKGFRVLVVVADGLTVNRKVFRQSAVDEIVPYKCPNIYAGNEERALYFISDAPHLLKTARNCFSGSSVSCKPRRMVKEGKEILWSHLLAAYNESLKDKYKISWRLTREHLYLTPFSKMNVKLAAQVLSDRTAVVIEEIVGDCASETSKFIKLMNKWFDCVNARNMLAGVKTRNPNLNPYRSLDDPRLKWLEEEFLGYLIEWKGEVDASKYTEEEKKRMMLSEATMEGFQITVHSIIEATRFLLNKGAKYVLTTHFNQDILEQEFSRVRRSGGCNENPTVMQFCQSERRLNAVRQYVTTKTTGNTTVVGT